MAIPITIPRLGWSAEEGTFGGWLKNDGDEVRPGDRLFVFETEKAAEEIETLDSGILRLDPDGLKVGDVVQVGMVIGFLAEPGEIVDFLATESADERPAAPEGRTEAVVPRSNATGPAISPRARRVANELGIDWMAVRGSGKTGRIREQDILAAAGPNAPHPQPLSPRSGGRGETGGQLIPHSQVRRTIAARMVESQRLTAPVTLTSLVDATNLVALRNQFKSRDVVPSYTDLIIKLCAIALKQHSLLAGQWTDEGIRLPDAIHIGIAVDTEDGLRVPVIRDAAALEIGELAKRSRDLIERARTNKLAVAEMQGGCFTVSNLGAYGIDGFTPIINYPECAVLGVGRIARRPAVIGDAIVPRDQVTLSLTFDHRIVDGAPAARFLQTLSQLIENPGSQP